jgi:hypothetical protein
MARFMALVELKQPKPNLIPSLHDVMEEEGFRKTIRSNEGNTYTLPDGQYRLQATIDLEEAYNRAKNAIRRVHDGDYSLIVSGQNHSMWRGLEQED